MMFRERMFLIRKLETEQEYNMKKRKKVARRNRYFTSNAGNESGNFATFTAWKKREKANEKEGLKSE